MLITDKEPCKFAVNKRQNTNYSFLPVTSIRSVAYGKNEVKLFACKEITNRWSFSFSKGEKWFEMVMVRNDSLRLFLVFTDTNTERLLNMTAYFPSGPILDCLSWTYQQG